MRARSKHSYVIEIERTLASRTVHGNREIAFEIACVFMHSVE
jgi:hypothetical protein